MLRLMQKSSPMVLIFFLIVRWFNASMLQTLECDVVNAFFLFFGKDVVNASLCGLRAEKEISHVSELCGSSGTVRPAGKVRTLKLHKDL